jgi:hypothetical protein
MQWSTGAGAAKKAKAAYLLAMGIAPEPKEPPQARQARTPGNETIPTAWTYLQDLGPFDVQQSLFKINKVLCNPIRLEGTSHDEHIELLSFATGRSRTSKLVSRSRKRLNF